MLLEFDELAVTNIFRVYLAGSSQKTGQWNRVETVSATNVSRCIPRLELENFDNPFLQLGGPILLRTGRRRLAEQTGDSYRQHKGASKAETSLNSHDSYCTRKEIGRAH